MRERVVYFDGRFVPAASARVPIDDQGFLHGYGVFETFRAYRGRPFGLDRHLARLARGLDLLRIPVAADPETWTGVFASLLERNGLQHEDAELRIRVSAGPKGGSPTVLATADPLGERTRRLGAHGVRAVTLSNPRPAHYLRGHKTANYLESSLGLQEAEARGADEGLFVDPAGNYLEGCATNLFAVGGKTLRAAAAGVLPGITRAIVLEIAVRRRFPIVLWPLEPALVKTADELFVTNALIGVAPVIHLDGEPRKAGPVAKQLAEEYRSLVESTLGK